MQPRDGWLCLALGIVACSYDAIYAQKKHMWRSSVREVAQTF